MGKPWTILKTSHWFSDTLRVKQDALVLVSSSQQSVSSSLAVVQLLMLSFDKSLN